MRRIPNRIAAFVVAAMTVAAVGGFTLIAVSAVSVLCKPG